MKINIKELFPIINIIIDTQKAVINEKAKDLFKNREEIEATIKKLDLNKKVDFCYISEKFYVVNIIRGIKNIYLLFTEVEDGGLPFNTLQSEKGVSVDLYQRDVLKEFLEKFLALKRRYGGFSIKFLYLKVNFTLNLSSKLKREYLHKISKYMLGVTRSSDVVGQITESSFGIILTNANIEGANVVANKILKFVSEINTENDKRLLEVYGTLAHEIFILKHSEFNDFIKNLKENSEFITIGIKLKELVK